MINFEKEELLKIAELSGLTLDLEEIELFRQRLTMLIDYSAQLDQVNIEELPLETQTNVNVFRKDKVIKSNSEKVLEQAPEKIDHYFIVPKIIK